MRRICFVLCYIGPLPRYVPTFLATCARNEDVDFLIASDQPAPPGLGANIRWTYTTLAGLRDRLSDVVGFPVSLPSGYKLCDYKPVLGQAFSEELEGYEFWGFCDPDLVWGHIRSFATDSRLSDYDILTFRGRDFISGPCTLVRNAPPLNGLYAESPTYQQVFQTPQIVSFTERAGRALRDFTKVEDLVASGQPVSFTDVVRRAMGQGRVQWLDVDEIVERDPANHRLLFEWRRGRLFQLLEDNHMWGGEGREILLYHYVGAKEHPWFYIPNRADLPPVFRITERGPFTPPASRVADRLSFEAHRLILGLPRFSKSFYRRVSSKMSKNIKVLT